MLDKYEAVPLKERVVHYRRMAEDALSAAHNAHVPSCQDELKCLAQGWYCLAMQIEQTLLEAEPGETDDDAD